MQKLGSQVFAKSGFVLAIMCVVSMVVAAPALAVQDRALEWVPPLGYGPNSDTCYSGDPYEFTVVWRECASTAAWPQYRKWQEAKVTNSLNTYGVSSVGVTNGPTLAAYTVYAAVTGAYGTWAYTNSLPHSSWPALGIAIWNPAVGCQESRAGYGSPGNNCLWEDLTVFWGN